MRAEILRWKLIVAFVRLGLPFLLVWHLINTDAAAQNFWQQTKGIDSGTGAVRAFAINSSGHIFAGTYGDGVFRSTDNGDSWRPVNTGLTSTIVLALAINSSGHIFAGTYGGGVFRSINNGDSWRPVNTGLTSTIVLALAINTSGDIFAGTAAFYPNLGGVFRSTNNGDSWTAANIGLPSNNLYPSVQSLAINANGDIFAGTHGGGGAFRSINNGDSWTAVNIGLTSTVVYALAINANGNIFAGTNGRVFLSSDNGGNWTAVNTGVTGIFFYAFAINFGGHIFAGSDGGGVFRSTDNGDLWTQVNTGLTNAVVNALSSNSTGYIFAGTDSGKVFRSWQSTLTPIVITNVATSGGGTAATLYGTVIPSGLSTTVKFQYGTTPSYGNEVVALESPANGTSEVLVSAVITGLTPDTRYHFRAVATNSAGTAEGENQTFSTQPCETLTITHTPLSSHEADSTIKIIADIVSACGVDSARLEYRRGGDPKFTIATKSNSVNSYQWTIPASAVTTHGMEYFISAKGVLGTTPKRVPSSGFFLFESMWLKVWKKKVNNPPAVSRMPIVSFPCR